MLQSSWNRCWRGLGAQGDGMALLRKLISAYEEPQRKYHTVQHLSECIDLLTRNMDLANAPAEVEAAIWFHDAIYDVRANNNEERSEAWAKKELLAAGVHPDKVERIKAHISATRHVTEPQGADQQLLVDIDLSILGAPRHRFDEYEAQVRSEYDWVPEFLYRKKRKKVLTEFLARSSIYSTGRLHDQLERQARANLAYSIQKLGTMSLLQRVSTWFSSRRVQ